jgi:hypothetical protein
MSENWAVVILLKPPKVLRQISRLSRAHAGRYRPDGESTAVPPKSMTGFIGNKIVAGKKRILFCLKRRTYFQCRAGRNSPSITRCASLVVLPEPGTDGTGRPVSAECWRIWSLNLPRSPAAPASSIRDLPNLVPAKSRELQYA